MTPFRHAARPVLSPRILLSLFFFAIGSVPATAQVCAGAPSFANFRWHSNVGLELGDGGKGSARNVFAALGTGRGTIFGFGRVSMEFGDDDLPGRGYGVGGIVGADFGIGNDSRLHVCPVFGAEHVFGPNGEFTRLTPIRPGVMDVETGEVESDSTLVSGGVLVGYVWSDNRLRRLIPTLGVVVVEESISASFKGVADPDISDSYVELRTGLGLVLNDQMALTPIVVVPIGTDLRGVALRIAATLGF